MRSHAPLLAALGWLLGGCAVQEQGSFQLSSLQTSSHRASAQVSLSGGPVDLDAIVREVKVVAKREATARQRATAHARARRAWGQMSPARRTAFKQKKVRYLAVKTERTEQSVGAASVMIWDTFSQDVVANNVYDIAAAPSVTEVARFQTFAAEYVGGGM